MEPQTTLVGADRAVHLDAEAPVDLDLATVVDPGHPEHDHSLRLDQALEDLGLAVLRPALEDQIEGSGHLADRLVELRLAGVPGLDVAHQPADVVAHRNLLWGALMLAQWQQDFPARQGWRASASSRP